LDRPVPDIEEMPQVMRDAESTALSRARRVDEDASGVPVRESDERRFKAAERRFADFDNVERHRDFDFGYPRLPLGALIEWGKRKLRILSSTQRTTPSNPVPAITTAPGFATAHRKRLLWAGLAEEAKA
jgi:hypothetical protein